MRFGLLLLLAAAQAQWLPGSRRLQNELKEMEERFNEIERTNSMLLSRCEILRMQQKTQQQRAKADVDRLRERMQQESARKVKVERKLMARRLAQERKQLQAEVQAARDAFDGIEEEAAMEKRRLEAELAEERSASAEKLRAREASLAGDYESARAEERRKLQREFAKKERALNVSIEGLKEAVKVERARNQELVAVISETRSALKVERARSEQFANKAIAARAALKDERAKVQQYAESAAAARAGAANATAAREPLRSRAAQGNASRDPFSGPARAAAPVRTPVQPSGSYGVKGTSERPASAYPRS